MTTTQDNITKNDVTTKTCRWTRRHPFGSDAYYETWCGDVFAAPKESDYEWCPFCGRKIEEVIH